MWKFLNTYWFFSGPNLHKVWGVEGERLYAPRLRKYFVLKNPRDYCMFEYVIDGLKNKVTECVKNISF